MIIKYCKPKRAELVKATTAQNLAAETEKIL